MGASGVAANSEAAHTRRNTEADTAWASGCAPHEANRPWNSASLNWLQIKKIFKKRGRETEWEGGGATWGKNTPTSKVAVC